MFLDLGLIDCFGLDFQACRLQTLTLWGHQSHCMEMLGKAWTTVRKAADACQEWGGGWWRITLWTVGPMRWRLQLWPTQSRKGDKTARAHLCTWELKPVQEDTSKPRTLDMSPSQMSSRLRLGMCSLAKETEQSQWCLNHLDRELWGQKSAVSFSKLNSVAQLTNDILLEFLPNLYFTGHFTFGQSHRIVR